MSTAYPDFLSLKTNACHHYLVGKV